MVAVVAVAEEELEMKSLGLLTLTILSVDLIEIDQLPTHSH